MALTKMITNFLYSKQTWDCAERSEVSLLHFAQSGSLEAFNALVLKYQDVMYRTALGILGQDAPAEDATQEAFLSAYQNIINFRFGSFKAWLMRILVNKCYDMIRHMKCTASISLNESLTDEGENESIYVRFQNSVLSLEEYVEASERNKYIHECLSKLPVN